MLFKEGVKIFVLLCVTTLIFAEKTLSDGKTGASFDGSQSGRQYAVFIAINQYENWNPLKGPVNDAEEIRKILSAKYSIDVTYSLYNGKATKKNILSLFQALQKELTSEDSLLIFYAGHGYLDNASKTGFWIPVDGGTDKLEQSRWIPNIVIRGLISNIKAKHVLLISDSCFSGDILNTSRGLNQNGAKESLREFYQRRSRQVLASGSSEMVPDQSKFAQLLKLTLDENNKNYLDSFTLFNEIRLGMKETTPMLGDLKDSGYQEGGSFVLFLKDQQKTNLEAKEPKKEIAENRPFKNPDAEQPGHGWFFFGLGSGAGSGGSGSDYNGLAYGLGFSYQFGHVILTGRIAGVSEINLFGASNDVGDLAGLVGFCVKGRYGMFSMGTGVSVVNGNHSVSYGLLSSTPDQKKEFTTVGLPLEMQTFFTPFEVFGLGVYWYANLNPEKSFYGFLVAVQIGNLWD